jgi:hypothetical protein
LLGETLSEGDPELDRTYALFVETLREGRAGIGQGAITTALPGPCQSARDHWTGEKVNHGLSKDDTYAVRAWMAVVSYLLADYKFLYE